MVTSRRGALRRYNIYVSQPTINTPDNMEEIAFRVNKPSCPVNSDLKLEETEFLTQVRVRDVGVERKSIAIFKNLQHGSRWTAGVEGCPAVLQSSYRGALRRSVQGGGPAVG